MLKINYKYAVVFFTSMLTLNLFASLYILNRIEFIPIMVVIWFITAILIGKKTYNNQHKNQKVSPWLGLLIIPIILITWTPAVEFFQTMMN